MLLTEKMATVDRARPFAYGTRLVSSCIEGYRVRDPLNVGTSSTTEISCGLKREWLPSLDFMQCFPITCQPLIGLIGNVRLSQGTFYRIAHHLSSYIFCFVLIILVRKACSMRIAHKIDFKINFEQSPKCEPNCLWAMKWAEIDQSP